MANKKRQPWERWLEKVEGPNAHDLFLVFLQLGMGRFDLGKAKAIVAEKTGRKLSTVNSLCSKFQWVRRARAYDEHLNKVQQDAIERQKKADAVIMAERDSSYRFEAYDFAEKLLAKAMEMLDTPIYTERTTETREIDIGGGETVEIPVKIEKKPVKWGFKDMVAIAEFSDKLRRMAMGVPTSKVAVEVSLSLEERVAQAKASFLFWKEHKLERAIQRVLEQEPEKDYWEVKEQLLAEAPLWFAEDHKVPDPSLLLTEGENPPALSLDDGTEAVN